MLFFREGKKPKKQQTLEEEKKETKWVPGHGAHTPTREEMELTKLLEEGEL